MKSIREQISPENNIAHYFLRQQAESWRGQHAAIIDTSGEVTYSQLMKLSTCVAIALQEMGVEKGDRVVIALPDSIGFAAALFGIVHIGGVVVMVDPNRPQDIPGKVAKAEAKLVIGDPNQGFCNLARLTNRSLRDLPIQPLLPSDDALWLWSGGTTQGDQKLVRQVHGSYISVTEYLAKEFLLYTASDRTLSIPRLFFGYATGGNLLFPLAVGGISILSNALSTPEGIFKQIERYFPTIVINTPAMIAKMVAVARERAGTQFDLSSVRMMTSAGEKLPESLHREWMELFPDVPICDGLGFAEHWWCAFMNRPGEVWPGTVGRVIPPIQFKVCDVNSNEVAPGKVGVLWVKGPAFAKGYFEDEEATRKAFRDGWFVTGDLVQAITITPDGHPRLIYKGRADNSFKVSGQWMYPTEVENCIRQLQWVAECAVIGYTTDGGFTKPAAFVVRRDNTVGGDELSVKKHVLANLAKHKCPQRVLVLNEKLPRTPFDKINLAALREML